MNVLPVPRLVYCGYFVHVLAVYLQCTSPVHHPLPPVYADAQVEAVNVQCMPRGEFRQLVSTTVRESLLTRVHLELREIRSSLEVLQGGNELMLATGLSRIRTMQAAFVPTVVEGSATPKSVEGGHLTEEGDGEEEGNDGEETSL